MSDDNNHLDTFARGVAMLEMTRIPVLVIRDFAVTRGWAFGCESGRSIMDFVEAFTKRFPAWKTDPYDRGIEPNHEASAHAKMAWMAFSRQVRAEMGVAS